MVLFSAIYTLKPPRCKANVFLSSSRADCKLEREILFNYILPRLREEHKGDDIDISVSDMRWGISDRRSDAHMSWIDCSNEIRRCHDQSHGGFFFLSLQGDKYGHTTLPHTIPKEVFEKCCVDNIHMYENRVVVIDKHAAGGGAATDEQVQDMINNLKNEDSNRSLAAVAKLWYDLDEKNDPPVYVLRPLSESNKAEWLVDKVCILKFFENVECFHELLDHDDDEPLVINRSVSEFEIKYAYSLARGKGPLSTPLWINRQFVHNGNLFCYDKSSAMKIENLKAWMIGEMASRNSSQDGVFNLSVNFEEYVAGKGSSYDIYVEAWTTHVYEKLLSTVQHCLETRSEWWIHHCKLLNVKKDDLEEIICHYQHAQEQCDIFVARAEIMSMTLKQVAEWKRYQEIDFQHRLAGVCLSIVGEPGIGKSCFMAALAQQLRAVEKDKVDKGLPSSHVVSRFIGLTHESVNGLNLVRNICVEIQGHFELSYHIPNNYEGVISHFHMLLKEYSVILLLDGLDSLSADYMSGRNMLSLLTNVDPHANGRVIVSTRHDEKEKKTPDWRVCYGCDSRLQESKISRIKLTPFEDKTSDYSVDSKSEVLLVVRSYISLYGNGVTLRRKQIDKVLKRLAYDRPPTPLAAILASRLLVNNHRSSSFTVEKTDTTLISQSFKLLENEYGKRLTVLAFSFITFSVRGVSDIELLDLLSLDNELNASMYEYRSCSKHRVSTHIWQRLKNGAGILLRENKQGRLEWTHRKVRAYAVHKYSEQKFTKKYVHSLLGQYFASIVDKRIRSERSISQQSITLNSIPVWFSNSHVNNRRYEEGLHNLIEANLLTEACDEVCDVDNVCAFFKCGLRNQFVRDVIKLHRTIVLTGESKRTVFSFSESFFNKVDCYMRWVRQMNGMIANFSPACGIFSTVSATQPVYSDVLKDAFALRDAEYDKTSGETVGHYFSGKWPDISTELIQFSDTTWNRGVCFSENIQFQSIISTFCHEHPIKCVEWMDAKSDTKFVSIVNKNMFIWDTVKEEIVDSFTLYSDIYSVATNKSSTRLACGCKDRLIRIFDTQSGLLWLTIGGHSGFVTSLNFSNCGTKLCSGGTDCSIKLWNMTAAGAAITSFEGHSFEVTQVMFSPDDKRIVSGSLDKTVKMWEIETGELMFTLELTFSHVHSVVFDPTGEKIAVGSSDNNAYIMNSWTDELLYTLEGHEGPVTSVAFSPDGTLVASGSLDRTLKIWHVVSGIMVGSLHDHTEGIKSVKFSFDSQKVITASNDKTVRMFDVATELLAPIENTFDSYFEGNKCPINSVSFSPDGSTLVSTAGKLISLWNVHSRKLLANLDGHNDEVLSAAYNTSNSKICSCAKDGTVIVWDSITYEVIATRTESSVMSASFTLDGYKIVLRTSDYRVSFWDYFAGNIIHEYCNPLQVYRHDPYQVNLVTFCPEGLMKTISIVNSTVSINGIDVEDDSRQEVQLWDVVSKELISTLDPHPPLPTTPPACISDDDGHEFPDEEDADSSDGVVGVLSRSFSFSPDGLSVAVGYTDGAIVVSHSRNGKTVMTLSGHRASVSTLCFNIEGLRLVSGSEDCSIKIWDIHAGMLVTTLYGHRDTVRHVTYSPCGLKVASSSSDKTLILWDAVSLKERVEVENTIEDDIRYNVDSAVENSFVSQMTAIIGNVEKTVDPDDEFLNAEELRIKSYQFQYVDGW